MAVTSTESLEKCIIAKFCGRGRLGFEIENKTGLMCGEYDGARANRSGFIGDIHRLFP
jgi:hypothetical protein